MKMDFSKDFLKFYLAVQQNYIECGLRPFWQQLNRMQTYIFNIQIPVGIQTYYSSIYSMWGKDWPSYIDHIRTSVIPMEYQQVFILFILNCKWGFTQWKWYYSENTQIHISQKVTHHIKKKSEFKIVLNTFLLYQYYSAYHSSYKEGNLLSYYISCLHASKSFFFLEFKYWHKIP
jgi:hypothetical protein